MQDYIKDIIKAIIVGVIAVFLPKHILLFVREIIKFVFFSVFKYWYASVLISLIALVAGYVLKTQYPYVDTIRYVSVCIFIVGIVTLSYYSYVKELSVKASFINIALFGCYTVRESEYLIVDVDAEELNEKIISIAQSESSRIFTYRAGLVDVNFVRIPNFIAIFLGYAKLHKFLKTQVESGKHSASMHFIRNINKQNLSVRINCNSSVFSESYTLEKTFGVVDSVVSDPDVGNTKGIEISVKFYLLIFAQVVLDLLIRGDKISEVYYILDDSERLISEIRASAINFSSKSKNLINNFFKFLDWLYRKVQSYCVT
jgi:hypothetical protein